jgi:hypothetical protein
VAPRLGGEPSHRQRIGRARMIRRQQNAVPGVDRGPQPLDVATLDLRDPFIALEIPLRNAEQLEQRRPMRPVKRRDELVGLLNDDVLHGVRL